MRRHAIGLIALLLLATAAAGSWLTPGLIREDLLASLGRGGLLSALVWLAYDEIQRLPAWSLAGVPAILLVLVFWKRAAAFLIPMVIVLLVLNRLSGRGMRK